MFRKIAQGLRKEGDEDEGSSLQSEVNQPKKQVANLYAGKIERSAEALQAHHHLFSFLTLKPQATAFQVPVRIGACGVAPENFLREFYIQLSV